MNRALGAQRRGELQVAARCYEEALAIEPAQPDALHMRGVVALSGGDPHLAKEYILRAKAAGLTSSALAHNLLLSENAIRELERARGENALRCKAIEEAARWQHTASDPVVGGDEVKLLAFFLPQFHRVRENDEWWGIGFTEWTNVAGARPNFPGHDQPREPGELGAYNLLDSGVREAQARLAREYGISAFCYYHYWFAGRRLLEQPLDAVLASGAPDFPFCVLWANEHWMRTWDGGSNEVLIEQRHSDADDRAFIASLLPAFRDRRYLRVLGQPLLVVYRCERFPDSRRTFDLWRQVCIDHGEMPPFIVKADTSPSGSPLDVGADASVEFPPHRLRDRGLGAPRPVGMREAWRGTLFDMRSVAGYLADNPEPEFTHFRTVVPRWDNTPRRQNDGTMFLNASPPVFRAWLRETIVRARDALPPGQRLVFINAWNEWAEGAYLEPDRAAGRAYLEAARDARRIPREFVRLHEVIERLRTEPSAERG